MVSAQGPRPPAAAPGGKSFYVQAEGGLCIDVAGGTGDIALRILDWCREKYADRETSVEVVDINPEMLKEGYTRFKKTMYHNSAFALFRSKPAY